VRNYNLKELFRSLSLNQSLTKMTLVFAGTADKFIKEVLEVASSIEKLSLKGDI